VGRRSPFPARIVACQSVPSVYGVPYVVQFKMETTTDQRERDHLVHFVDVKLFIDFQRLKF
jgi:hypothetical protein